MPPKLKTKRAQRTFFSSLLPSPKVSDMSPNECPICPRLVHREEGGTEGHPKRRGLDDYEFSCLRQRPRMRQTGCLRYSSFPTGAM
jgi:hypothetical protein